MERVCNELRDPYVLDVLCHVINMSDVDMDILQLAVVQLATALSRQSSGGKGESGGGGGESASKGSHTDHVAECTEGHLGSPFMTGLGRGYQDSEGGDRDLLNCRPREFVGFEEQANSAAQRGAPLRVMANNPMPPIGHFSQNYEEQPSYNQEREMNECEPSLHQAPTEETLPPNNPSVMNMQSGSVLEPVQCTHNPIIDMTNASPPALPSVTATFPPATTPPGATPPPAATPPGATPPPAVSQPSENRRKWLTSRRCKQEIKHLLLPYRINKRGKHGLALIIVNETFRHHPDHPEKEELRSRDCANEDLRMLQQLCRFLGYRVRVERDLTSEQIENLFDQIRKEIQSQDDSFLCFISSHGTWDPAQGTDVVYGVEGVWMEKDGQVIVKGAVDIRAVAYEKLSDLLKGQPKMFFVQACRGKEYGRVSSENDARTDTLSETDGKGPGAPQPAPMHLLRETDFLFSYATAPGYKAYRRGNGSFFITYLCQFLKDYAHKLPLVPILDAVSQKLAALESPHEYRGMKTRQSPNYSNSLRGPVFFFNKSRKRYKRKMLSNL